MNKQVLAGAALITSFLSIPPVTAQEMATQSGRFSLGGAFTSDKIEDGVLNDNRNFGFKIQAGYQFHENFQFFVGYQRFGEAFRTISAGDISSELCFPIGGLPFCPELDAKLDIDNLFGKLRGKYQFENNAFVFADLSLNSWDADVTVSANSSSETESVDGTDVSWGLGAGYRWANSDMVVSYEAHDFDGSDVDTLSFELNYYF